MFSANIAFASSSLDPEKAASETGVDMMDRHCVDSIVKTKLFDDVVQDFQGFHDAAFENLKFETKQDGSLVSNFEQTYENRLCKWLQDKTPWAGFQGEEGHTYTAKDLKELGYDGPTPSPYCWYCDPIDGTISFRNGLNTYGFTLTLARATKPIATLVHFPKLKQTFTAFLKRGLTYNGTEITIPPLDKLADFRVIAQSDSYVFNVYHKEFLKEALDALPGIKRTYTDIHGYSLSALGQCVGTVDAAGALWDLLPGFLLIREAGGETLFVPAETPELDHYGALVVGPKGFVDEFQKKLESNKNFLKPIFRNEIPVIQKIQK